MGGAAPCRLQGSTQGWQKKVVKYSFEPLIKKALFAYYKA